MPETIAVGKYGVEVRRLARSVAARYGNESLVPDLEQEGLIELVRVVRRGPIAWDTYGRIQVYNAMRMYARRERKRGGTDELLEDNVVDLHNFPKLRITMDEVLRRVAQLPEPHRSVIVWTACGEEQGDIARALGISQQRVSAILKKAQDRLGAQAA